MGWKKCVKVIVVAAACAAAAYAGVSVDDFAVGATYHMVLTTGDELEGVVDSKNDTSLVLDCKGNAYTFAAGLISDYQLIAPPARKGAPQAGGAHGDLAPISYDQLKQQQTGTTVQVKIKSGAVFTGNVASIDDDNIRLDVGGSVIPISKRVVDQLALAPEAPAPNAALVSRAPDVIYDTLIIKNPESDEYGRQNPHPRPIPSQEMLPRTSGSGPRCIVIIQDVEYTNVYAIVCIGGTTIQGITHFMHGSLSTRQSC